MGDAFEVAADDPLAGAFQAACGEASGARLPFGDQPFLDDGNRFIARGVTAITHGPAATGAHTPSEVIPVAELVRVARVYALTALRFCGGA